MELIQKLVPVCMLVFVLCSMLAMGFGLTVGEIIAPLRDIRRVVLSLLANFLLVPLIALALAAILRLDEPLGVGLLLLGSAAGAPFLPKLTQLAKGNLVGWCACFQSPVCDCCRAYEAYTRSDLQFEPYSVRVAAGHGELQ